MSEATSSGMDFVVITIKSYGRSAGAGEREGITVQSQNHQHKRVLEGYGNAFGQDCMKSSW